jgi:hypothetical protein
MHNTSQMSFNPNTGLIYVPISADSHSASSQRKRTRDARPQNFGMGSTRGASVTLANPPTHGPERKNPDGSACAAAASSRHGIRQLRRKLVCAGGGQTGGGTLSTASNLVIQTLNGRIRAYTADKGEQLLDMALPVAAAPGAPMTFMLDGKQYIAVVAGNGQRGGGGRGGAAGGAPAPGGAGRGAPPAGAPPAPQQEATAAAAQRGNTPAPAPAPGAPAGNNNPKMFVYSVPN